MTTNYQAAQSPSTFSWVTIEDERGTIRVLEETLLPFLVKRIFTISTNSDNGIRGGHAHKECWQLLFTLDTGIKITIKNENLELCFDLLPGTGLIIPPWNWSKVDFESKKTSVTVLASHPYDKNDYIYQEPNSVKSETR